MKNSQAISKRYGTVIARLFLIFYIITSTSTAISLWYINDSIQNLSIELHQYTTVADTKTREMRVTGYTPTGNKTAIGKDVVVGWTAAVSPNCIDLLNEEIYITGYGVRLVNDLTANHLDDEFGICTIDLAVPTKQDAMNIGSNICTVVKLTK